MKTSEFNYELPKELIAQTPLESRTSSRLLVLDRTTGGIEHKHFEDIVNYLNPGDTLVLNNTRVIPARVYGKREGFSGIIEVLLLKEIEKDIWQCLVKKSKKVLKGTTIIFSDKLKGEVLEELEEGLRLIKFDYDKIFNEILKELGTMPLPPYITKRLEDKERYQTVYSKIEGSAAAPTAGLHFTDNLLNKIKNMQVNICYITLHVGLDTFRPVKVEDITNHKMHNEYFEIDKKTCDIINETKRRNNKIIVVGTTTVRALESAADKNKTIHPMKKETDIFIYPGYKFKIVDNLITNFHLPKSTLLMLVSALSSKDNIINAYNEAIRKKYRFFSFGDAMYIKGGK